MKRLLKGIFIVFVLFLISCGVVYHMFPGFIFESGKHALRWWAGLERHEVRVDEHKWAYLSGGKGETILFIHGFGADKDRWGLFLNGFSGSHKLIVPDLPGFGESSKIPSASYDIASQVKRLNRFVEKIGLDRFHLVGISMGGYISAYYAGEYPQKVKGLALISSAGVKSRVPSYFWQRYKRDGRVVLLYKTREEFDEFLSVLFFRPPWIPGRLKAYLAREGASNHLFRKKILQDMARRGLYLLEGRLHKIQARTLLIWGADDRIIHLSSVEKLEKGLKNSRTVIIDECGHVPYIEKSKETIQAYRNFLAGSH
jgi:pimeloyl-ACP methyl ester carboxylesterase